MSDKSAQRYTLNNGKLEVQVSNLGGTLLSIRVPDKDGIERDVLLGYKDLQTYLELDGYLGACIGRVANRIRRGEFTLNGKQYHLPINNGPNSLHGGIKGFSYQLMEAEDVENGIRFSYQAKDGEEGYPGNLDFSVTFTLEDDTLHLHYEARSDQDTLVNFTNHAYFALAGRPKWAGEQLLQVKADRFAAVDSDGLVTGAIEEVENTPFDFRQLRPMSQALNADASEQIAAARGLDHPYLFNTDKEQVIVQDPETGIALSVTTTMPIAHIYTANYLDGRTGKDGLPMNAQDAVCVETEFMPDDITRNPESPTILRKGERFTSDTWYRFSTNTCSQAN